MPAWIVLLASVALADPAPQQVQVEVPAIVLPSVTVRATSLKVEARTYAPVPVVAASIPDVAPPAVLASDMAIPLPRLRPATNEVASAR